MKEPLFSIVIPAFNEARLIGACLESLRRNHFPEGRFEIIVVDDGSTDDTAEIARKLGSQVMVNDDRRKTIAALRNMGAERARGRVLVFLDADVAVPGDMLAAAWRYFGDGFDGALGFVDRPPPEAGWVGKTWGDRFSHLRGHVKEVDFVPSRNVFVSRRAFGAAGGFNERLATNEDKDFSLRILAAGFRLLSVPSPEAVHHGYERNLREFVAKESWRQGDTLALAREWGYSIRTLRNPLLSLWHLLFLVAAPSAALFQKPSLLAAALLLWLFPTVLLVFRPGVRRPGFFGLLKLALLTFLRWNVAAVALVRQVVSLAARP